MVLTDDTFKEQEEYFSLFKDIVDDVSVKRGIQKEEEKLVMLEKNI